MPFMWKRVLLSIATIGVGAFAYTHSRLPHTFAPGPGTSLQSLQQTNQQLQKQLSSLGQQATDLETQVKTDETAEKTAQTSLTTLQQQAVILKAQLQAKKAKAAELALERKRTQVVTKTVAPAVQTVTRASGSSDDDGGGNKDD